MAHWMNRWLIGLLVTLLAAAAAMWWAAPPVLAGLLLLAAGGLSLALQASHRQQVQTMLVAAANERERLQTERATQQRLVRRLGDAVPSLVSYFDAGLHCRFVNGASSNWLGRPAEEVVGLHLQQMVTAAAHHWHEPYFRAALAGQRQRYQRTVTDRQGLQRHMLFTLIPDSAQDQVQGVISIVSDISDVKDSESRLVALNEELAARAHEAQAATVAKSAFLANMSHEIRTPMNAIIGLTHLMARDSRDTLQRDRLSKVDAAAKHLLRIINDVLDLSKIEAGKMTLERAEFALDALLTRSFELVGDQARDKGLELILDTDHLPSRLSGDATRLQQALVNLLVNAVKFTDQGWVRLRGEVLREERERVQVRFEVQDTGAGIAPEAVQILFTAFEQADSSITRSHGGTGLGLALTRHLVHLMGGEIDLHSSVGVGSRFSFTAWLGKAEEAGQHAAPQPLQGLRVLVVDDLPEALASLSQRLLALGLRVDSATSGAQALERVQDEMRAARPYDLFLIDWKMAPLDGIETLHRLRDLLGDGLPPSLLVTAFDEAAMWQQARSARYGAVLVKPITPSALHDAVVRLLRRQPGNGLTRDSQPGQAEAQLRRRHAGQRVLLVEDNPINQDVADELLRAAGLVVDCAGDGERAVELAASRAYDLVLMDLQMPVLDGLSATRAIRQRVGQGLPIVAMTANAYGEDRLACLAAGMNDHVPKPVDPEQLYATLLRWLPVQATRDAARSAPVAAPPRPGVGSLVERLAAVEGCDTARALLGVNGQLPVLQRVLTVFVQTYAAGLPALPQSAQIGNWQACLQACHSLRGACATIGLLDLAAQAQVLETACGTPQSDLDRVQAAQALHASVQAMVQRLRAALD